MDKIDFVLSRGGVIVGRVVDELGEPMAEVFVQAMRFVSTSGAPRLVPMGRNASTDDLGQFRLYGLPPGEYIRERAPRATRCSAGRSARRATTPATRRRTRPARRTSAEATRVQVQAGQEMNADMQLTAARMLRVSGDRRHLSAAKPAEGGIRPARAQRRCAMGGQ